VTNRSRSRDVRGEDKRPCNTLANVPKEKTSLHGCVMRQRERTEDEADEVTTQIAGTCYSGDEHSPLLHVVELTM